MRVLAVIFCLGFAGCAQMVALDTSIDTDGVLCQYYNHYPRSIYQNKQTLVNELRRRGVSREDCIELTGSEGIYGNALGPRSVARRQTYSAPRQSHPKVSRTVPVPPKPNPTPIPTTSAPQSSSGSGFFVSKLGHIVTNAHVVKNCKRMTVGDDSNKQILAALVSTDKRNDLGSELINH